MRALLIATTAILCAYLALFAYAKLLAALFYAGNWLAYLVSEPFASAFDDSAREARMQSIEADLSQRLGEDDAWGERERSDIVRAAFAAQRINLLNQELRKTAGKCLAVHWAIIRGLGSTDMSQAARHPLSQRLRLRVIDTSELLARHLATYPLIVDAPDLITLELGLRWIPGTCATCPYFVSTTANAPRVCPTAQALCADTPSSGQSVVDAEIVDE